MATIRKKGEGWQAVIRVGKYRDKPMYKTFSNKTTAKQWATKKEAEILANQDIDLRALSDIKVNFLLDKFTEEFVPTLGTTTQSVYGYIIENMKLYFFGATMDEFNSNAIKNYIESRMKSSITIKGKVLKQIGADAAIKELGILSRLFQFCQMVWHIPVRQNEAKEARGMLTAIGKLNDANVMRVDTYSDQDYDKIKAYNPVSKQGAYSPAKYALLFAIETGMRRAEIASMKWSRVHFKDGYYDLEREKSDYKKKVNRKGRIVPLTVRARALLRLNRYLCKRFDKQTGDRVWTWTRPDSASQAVSRMMIKLGIEELRLHSGRHDFGSRQANEEVDVRLTSAAMGHSDPRSMYRYTHPDMIKNAHKIKGRG